MSSNFKFGLGLGSGVSGVLVLSVAVSMVLMPKYHVYSSKMAGEAELAQATQNKQIIVQQAAAEKEAEILRAEGTAEANKIIGKSLENNDSYLHWLWINKLDTNTNKTVVYVPTDGMIPSVETGRIGTSK